MGNLLKRLYAREEVRVLMIGLDSAGKTTILYRLKLGTVVKTTPTIGFNVESIKHKNIKFTVWDVGGQDRLRKLWKHYYQGTQAIIFVVDSNDRERLHEARDELSHILADEDMDDVILLVLANKIDLPEATGVDDVTGKLGLESLEGHEWHVAASCAKTGEGLEEALDWLGKQLQARRSNKPRAS